MNDHNIAMEYRPTKAERFWKALGFRYHLSDLPDDAPQEGWMMTKTVIKFSMADRLRLLLSGELRIDIRQATGTKVYRCVTAVSFEITHPWRAQS